MLVILSTEIFFLLAVDIICPECSEPCCIFIFSSPLSKKIQYALWPSMAAAAIAAVVVVGVILFARIELLLQAAEHR
jgi:hypothetical protein